MLFNVMVGGYAATVELTMDGKGGFSGSLSCPEFGQGTITEGRCGPGGAISGEITLDGRAAAFTATITGNKVSGTISYGWFFSETFTGIETS